jgi:hypothetical protein
MNNKLLLLVPFALGVTLMVCSFFLSYPITVSSTTEYAFNDISILYWIALPLLLSAMFLIATKFENAAIKWIMTVGIIITLYSLSYFYFFLPGSDSQYFRGLTEYVIQTGNLTPIQPNHIYYQWPSFFIFSSIATSLSSIRLFSFEFILYTAIGILLSTTLYVYASRIFSKAAYVSVVAFFGSMYLFLNYQSVPFSLALSLLFLTFMVEAGREKEDKKTAITILILFLGAATTHVFVPLFFILYLVVRFILKRTKWYIALTSICTAIYLTVQFSLAQAWFIDNIKNVFDISPEYSSIVQVSLGQVQAPISLFAQQFTRPVNILFIGICVLGFLLMFLHKKLRFIDKGIFLTGFLYTALGFVFYTLGSRAWALLFIPVSLGIAYLFESKYRKSFLAITLILLVLFLFIPVRQSFENIDQVQTAETYAAQNFFIKTFDFDDPKRVLANFRVITYLEGKTEANPYYLNSDPNLVNETKVIFYTIGLGIDFQNINFDIESHIQEEQMDVLYTNGYSYIATNPHADP